MKPLFCLTIFLGSLLLFAIQPMVGKILLPSFGGTSAVWTTCVLFFQALLLVGYGYAHFVSGRLSPTWQVRLHFVLLAAVTLFLPMQAQASIDPAASDNPSLWLLCQLTVMTGLPFLVVSSNAPLLQRWYSVAAGEQGKDPYFLYAFSNAGSLLALLAYPLLMERSLGLSEQTGFWTVGFSLLAACFAGCGWFVFRARSASPAAHVARTAVEAMPDAPLTWKQRSTFIALAAIPSSLMLGVTSFVSTDAGSVPLLWVVPLAIYLLTFILGFAQKQVISHRWLIDSLPHLVLLVAILMLINPANAAWRLVPAHLLTFFVVAMVCHGELARLRPGAGRLTEFFLLLSIGGVVGGFFNAIVAPLVFNNVLEYPLVLVLACLMPYGERKSATSSAGVASDKAGRRSAARLAVPLAIALYLTLVGRTIVVAELANTAALLYLGIAMALAFLRRVPHRRLRFAGVLATALFVGSLYISEQKVVSIERGFFGVIKVKADQQTGMRMLVHGTTVHGIQRMSGEVNEPLSYYHRTGPVGDMFRIASLNPGSRIGVIGLGAGSIASYAQPGQAFDFFEIDPLVCRYASDPRFFTFLSGSAGECSIIVGDARIRLKQQLDAASSALPIRNVAYNPNESRGSHGTPLYDLLVLDAFSSDSIPCHLMTREAFAIYKGRMKADAILGVHISNRFLDLEPLCAALADDAGLHALIRMDICESEPDLPEGKKSSIYVVMSRNAAAVEAFAKTGNWVPLRRQSGLRLWTDEYSTILDVLR